MGMRQISSQKGQIVVEYTLLLLVVIGLASVVVSTLRSTEALKKLTFEPFAKIDGMIQCGAWEKCGVKAATPNRHPNTATRVLSLKAVNSP